ncbi:hypothetical protein O181_036961 [Austropuccinia psidii MF-1]|uniref:Prefoldin subunit 4 n=1 Tax=Austropuccinia psidii MF-1 TaxID=1389203 RepID=A0A9Q3HAC8_9BASI|nr:hypothetical protein [Austropuccinia psidii MF-1]
MQLLNEKVNPDNNEDIEVNFQDQSKINKFSNLNLKKQSLINELKIKSNELDDLNELENELMFLDFDEEVASEDIEENNLFDEKGKDEEKSILYKLDTSFVHLTSAEALDKVKDDLAKLKDEIEKLKVDQNNTNQEMNELKTVLYAKFGNTINLESEDQDE